MIHLLNDEKEDKNYVINITSKDIYFHKIDNNKLAMTKHSGMIGLIVGVPIAGVLGQYLYLGSISLYAMIVILISGISAGGILGVFLFRYMKKRKRILLIEDYIKLHPDLKKSVINKEEILNKSLKSKIVLVLMTIILIGLGGGGFTLFLIERNLLFLMLAIFVLSIGFGFAVLIEDVFFIMKLYLEERRKKNGE